MKRTSRRTLAHGAGMRDRQWQREPDEPRPALKYAVNEFFSGYLKQVPIVFLVIGFFVHSSTGFAASAISLAGVDFLKLCRDTAHVPLVQAAIHPAYINVWSVQESRQRGRYEQYSFHSQRIDVRVEHDISLYHGLIHRTLDLIGESQWKYRDLQPHEDHEHWLIYHTLETYWPGMQRRYGNEPTRSVLTTAAEYWTQYSARYAEIAAKASQLARKSWCASNGSVLEANAAPPLRPGLQRIQDRSMLLPVAQPGRDLPVATSPSQPAPQKPAVIPPPVLSLEAAPAPVRARPTPPAESAAEPARETPTQTVRTFDSLAVEPVGTVAEVANVSQPVANQPKPQAVQAQIRTPAQAGAEPSVSKPVAALPMQASAPAPANLSGVKPTAQQPEAAVRVRRQQTEPLAASLWTEWSWPVPGDALSDSQPPAPPEPLVQRQWTISADLPADPNGPAGGR